MVASTAGRRLMLVGAALMLISVALVGYSRVLEWRHDAAVQAVAPPTEVLADRLPLPTATHP